MLEETTWTSPHKGWTGPNCQSFRFDGISLYCRTRSPGKAVVFWAHFTTSLVHDLSMTSSSREKRRKSLSERSTCFGIECHFAPTIETMGIWNYRYYAEGACPYLQSEPCYWYPDRAHALEALEAYLCNGEAGVFQVLRACHTAAFGPEDFGPLRRKIECLKAVI